MRPTGTITERSKGHFYIRYNAGVDSLTGKRRRYGITIKGSYKEAEKELRRLLHAVDVDQHIKPNHETVAEFLQSWSTVIRSQVSPKTLERYEEIVRNFLIPAFGNFKLAKLTPSLIQQKYNGWENSGRRDNKLGGLAPRTRLNIHRIFRSALDHAVRLEQLARNPADLVKAPRPKKTTITTLTVEQSGQMLNHLHEKHPRLYWPVLLALTTGMRRGEILALRWKNVDFESRTVRVVESLEQVKQEIRFKAPKTEKGRAIVLPLYAVEELQDWKIKQARELGELGKHTSDNTLVCGRWDGEPVKPDSLTGEFVRAVRKIPGVPIVRFHDLRHSHATQLLSERIHPKIAQERLGHASIKTTLDLYSHVIDTMQEEAAQKLDFVFRPVIRTKLKTDPGMS